MERELEYVYTAIGCDPSREAFSAKVKKVNASFKAGQNEVFILTKNLDKEIDCSKRVSEERKLELKELKELKEQKIKDEADYKELEGQYFLNASLLRVENDLEERIQAFKAAGGNVDRLESKFELPSDSE